MGLGCGSFSLSTEVVVASPDMRPLPALDILAPPSSACPGQPTSKCQPCLSRVCLQACPQQPPLCLSGDLGHVRLRVTPAGGAKRLQLWALTPRQAPAKRWGPGALVNLHSCLRACGDPASGGLLLQDFGDLSGAWSFPSHARGSDVS